jgi:hypothetical protein
MTISVNYRTIYGSMRGTSMDKSPCGYIMLNHATYRAMTQTRRLSWATCQRARRSDRVEDAIPQQCTSTDDGKQPQLLHEQGVPFIITSILLFCFLLCCCHTVFLCFPSACSVSGVLLECPVSVVSVLIRSFGFLPCCSPLNAPVYRPLSVFFVTCNELSKYVD